MIKITSIQIYKLSIPLIRPFITALRRVDSVEDIVVAIHTNNGLIGYGSATATPVITGDNHDSIIATIKDIIAPKLINRDIADFENILHYVQNSVVNSTSAKAAIDIALYDLFAKRCNLPLYKFLGGCNNIVLSDTTISVKALDEMVLDAKLFVAQGFKQLKIKIGLNVIEDLARIKAVRHAVGNDIQICVDANQGYNVKQALQIIYELEQANLNLAMIEQPVKAHDLNGLKFIRDKVNSQIYADESCFSVRDASKIILNNIADGINIKLMKSGGIYNAQTIYALATNYDIPCMAGCMFESPIGVAAMASFVTSRQNIKFIDLDPPFMLAINPLQGGMQIDGAKLILSNELGLGIISLGDNAKFLHEVK